MPDAAVFIPTTAGADGVLRTLESMGSRWRPHCVVIDNASADDTAARVTDAYPEVQALRLPANLGFGPAINVAVRQHEPGEVLVILNDDVLCEADALDRVVSEFAEPTVGMAAGLLVEQATGTVDTAGIACDAALNAIDLLKGSSLADCELRPEGPEPIGPSGGFAAYRRRAFEEVGGFDEGFFAYYEDLDLALRLREAGWRARFVTTARAIHTGSATLGWKSLRKLEIVARSRGRIVAKYGVVRRPAALPWLVLELATCTVLSFEQRSLIPLRCRVRGFRDCRDRARYPAVRFISFGTFLRAIGPRLRRRYRPKAVEQS